MCVFIYVCVSLRASPVSSSTHTNPLSLLSLATIARGRAATAGGDRAVRRAVDRERENEREREMSFIFVLMFSCIQNHHKKSVLTAVTATTSTTRLLLLLLHNTHKLRKIRRVLYVYGPLLLPLLHC